MSRRHRPRHRLVQAAAAGLAASVVLTACGGGASDVAGAAGSAGNGSKGTIHLFAYSAPKPGYDKEIPAFNASSAGKGVAFEQSYGASGDQSRKVAAGAVADVVSFSLEPDITRLVDAGLVDKDWNAGEHKGVPFGSVVTIVVRKGNPKHIEDWDDLLQPGLQVVTPNPLSSGSAKWNLLAPYAAESDGGKNAAAGLAYVKALVSQHVKTQPASAREASDSFLQGTGDALISYENEALFLEKSGDPVEHVTPPTTFKIENPVAVVKTSKDLAAATAFVDFMYTPAGQKALAEGGFRPVDPAVAAQFASTFPAPARLWTIADLGGWSAVNSSLFDDASGSITAIYDAATK